MTLHTLKSLLAQKRWEKKYTIFQQHKAIKSIGLIMKPKMAGKKKKKKGA